MARKGYDKAYCPHCSTKMLRVVVGVGVRKKGWYCDNCKYWTTASHIQLAKF